MYVLYDPESCARSSARARDNKVAAVVVVISLVQSNITTYGTLRRLNEVVKAVRSEGGRAANATLMAQFRVESNLL